MKFIAELANTHEGSIEYLEEHIASLKLAGVENMKLQYLLPKEFGQKGDASFIEFSRLQIEDKYFKEILKKYSSINFYFDVFGNESLKKVIDLSQYKNVKGVKFHSTNSMNLDLIYEASKYFLEIFVSISGLTHAEIYELIEFFNTKKITKKIILTFGVQNYPAQIKDVKLNKLCELNKIFNIKICLSDHLDGDINLAKSIVLIAKFIGYDYIEKHSSLNRDRRMDDDHSSLNVDEIKSLLDDLRNSEELYTNNILKTSGKELAYRNSAKNVLCSSRYLPKGTVITLSDVRLKRGNKTLQHFINISDVVNKKTLFDINENTLLNLGQFQLNILGIVLVRNTSKRLPNKATRRIGEYSSIEFLIRRLKNSKYISKLIICTTNDPSDDNIEEIGIENNIEVFRGSLNIHERISPVLKRHKPDFFLRLTGDNIFVDSDHIDNVINSFVINNYDYYKHEKVIDGCDFEIIRTKAYNVLPVYFSNYIENSEYMTLFLKNSFFRVMSPKTYDLGFQFQKYRYTLDYIEDLNNLNNAFDFFKDINFSYEALSMALVSKKIKFKSFNYEDKSKTIEIIKRVSF